MIREIGDRIILAGVAHVLPQSKEEVERLIIEKKPRFVGVELCRKRYFELISNPNSREKKFEFSRAGILAYILSYLQERIGKKTGMLPGEEMLAAVKGANEIQANVVLLDRNIDITLQRLLDKMSIFEKVQILFSILLLPFQSGEKIKLEDVTHEEVVEKLISSFKEFSQTAYTVLIEERNKYMADRIWEILNSNSGKILCVVGAGHVPGLARELESRFEEKEISMKKD
ncbi:hypothetical protein AKJ50_00180 [candidate division MSBL1 archaeon SCGC-AAA382A13]|uniref:TraB family protein n=1 Tax=candidate division MSBL1 archaeon SCGC-AAA382A13 TaxID=1698279 RepID=A0A133VGX3_9EURY|nr:hypothetical protein AKJ50_00180 [candidate division MSBL1 archaeon SCGC-AAA382A13]